MFNKKRKEKIENLKNNGKEILQYGLKFAAYPDDIQKDKIDNTIGCCRFVYNYFKNYRDYHYTYFKESISMDYAKKMLTYYLKPSEQYAFLKDVDKFSLESSIEILYDAYDRFFNGLKKKHRVGFPRFKSKRNSKQSYKTKFTNGNIEIIEDKNTKSLYIKLPKIGKVKVLLNKNNSNLRKLLNNESRILNATISKVNSKYYISLTIEEEISKVISLLETKKVPSDKIIAGDLGIKTLLTTYNGKDYNEYENLRYFKRNQKRLKRLQQSLSRKKKDSKNYIKIKEKVANLHQRISNQRLDYNHKLSKAIVDENQVYISEDLGIMNMIKNHKLAKEILSCGWGQLVNFIDYKMKKKGGLLIRVDRFFPSSKLCSHCGYKYVDLTLNEREWDCPQCDNHNDRDINATINLRNKGIEELINMGIKVA